jgi:heptaprenyl diphosphate synthase
MNEALTFDTNLIKPRVTEELLHAIQNAPEPIYSWVQNLSSGKMLRPLLHIAFAHSLKPKILQSPTIYRTAAALELFHLATLVHDDILDSAAMRRGSNTLHTSETVRQAVIAGDYFFTKALSLYNENGRHPDFRLVSKGIAKVCEAELDQQYSGYSTSLRRYLRRIQGKTAILFMVAAHTGILEAGGKKSQVEAARRFGYNFGMYFQIMDDLLDLEGSLDQDGKIPGADAKNQILSLPLLLAARKDRDIFKDFKSEQGVSEKLRSKCAELGCLNDAREMAEVYSRRARGLVEGKKHFELFTSNLLRHQELRSSLS